MTESDFGSGTGQDQELDTTVLIEDPGPEVPSLEDPGT